MNGVSLSTYITVTTVSMALLLACFLQEASARKGCSAFGHSCHGGHGKRFDPEVRDAMDGFKINYEIPQYDQNEGFIQFPPQEYLNQQETPSERMREPLDLEVLVGGKQATLRHPIPTYWENK